ncbi:12889_t:CDS:1, partial [Cetraspora pellucida]
RARWIMCLKPFNFTIIYKARRKHNNADSLSRMYKLDKSSEEEYEVNLFNLPTEQEAFEAALAGNLITILAD